MSMPSPFGPQPGLLYIAKQAESATDQYKVGKTGATLRQRCQQLGGQTDFQFTMLRRFMTNDPATAESLAFKQFHAKGWRKYPGTRKEIFLAPMGALEQVCEEACRAADRLLKLAGSPVPTRSPPGTERTVTSTVRLWREALKMPLRFEGRASSLRDLMAGGIKDSRLHARLLKFGIRCCAVRSDKIDYTIQWAHAPEVVNWLQTAGLAIPSEQSTSFQLRIA